MRRSVDLLPAVAAALMITACASAPPRSRPLPPAPGNVPDAIPRVEPRSAHGNPPFYDVNGRRYQVLARADGYSERGVASWYGPDFHGRNTSSGERYDMYGMTAAHRTLPIPCYARITNLANGRSVVVRINDRGPFVANRIVDLSYSAAMRLDIVRTGTAFVELRTLDAGTAAQEAAAASAPVPEIAMATPSAAMPVAGQPGSPPPLTLPVAAPVVAPVAAPDSTPPVAPAAALYIQVGAYADAGNAQRVLDRLQSAGIARVFSLGGTAPGRNLRRVRIGPITTVTEFDQLAARLAQLGFPEARLAND